MERSREGDNKEKKKRSSKVWTFVCLDVTDTEYLNKGYAWTWKEELFSFVVFLNGIHISSVKRSGVIPFHVLKGYVHPCNFFVLPDKKNQTKKRRVIEFKKRFAFSLSAWTIIATLFFPVRPFIWKTMALWPHPNIFSFFYNFLIFKLHGASKQTDKCVSPHVISNEKKNGRSPAIWCAQRRTESNPPLVGGRWS